MNAPDLDRYLVLRERPAGEAVIMHQSWRSLLFLHWSYPAEPVQATLPPGLTVDTYEGRAYIGLIPFFMRAVRPRFLPAVPGISYFLETNVRTYVRDRFGRPGVWFYSLDANRRLAVWIARLTYRLPYFYADMEAASRDLRQGIDYRVARRGVGVTGSRFIYRSVGPAAPAAPGTLDFFLVERYLLFAAVRGGRLAAGRVFHRPYPLVPAGVAWWDSRLLELAGFEPPGRPPDHLIASPGVDVDVYPLRPLPEKRPSR